MPILLAVLFVSNVGAKPIRLRNETIDPASPSEKIRQAHAALLTAKSASTSSGLFLIQFTNSPAAATRGQLHSLGADLLRYVPDNAYVARLRNVKLDDIRALDSVIWVGEYKPEHKLHPRLQKIATNAVTGSVEVSVLLAPLADEATITQLKRFFSIIGQDSRLRRGHILRGTLNSAQLASLSRSDAVLWIEPKATMKLNDEVASKIVAGDGGPNVLVTQTLGYDGSGVKVAVADTGLNNGDAGTMHPDLFGRTPAFLYYGSLTGAADQHGHGTHIAGIIAGNAATGETDENGDFYGLGVAPGASIIAQRIFDGVGNYQAPSSNEKLTRDAVRAGADIGCNSWGDDTQGAYTLDAAEFDELVRDADAATVGDQPYILEFSAGNAGPGPQTIGSPAVAKNVIATGASQNNRLDFLIYNGGTNAMADFSSRGPCEDGRIKPDLVAPGTWVSSALSQSASSQFAWAPISGNYIYMGGTSQSGPHVAGAAAVFVQYYRLTHTNTTPSPALVKAALINSATDISDPSVSGPAPNNDEGWGRVSLAQIFSAGRTFDFVNQSTALTNSQIYQRQILVADASAPLKVTLAYTDVPGFAGAIPALVNDLDLEVIAPDGRSYHGNQFDNNGQSLAGATSWDNLNNVEGVLISSPIAGQYTLRVRAHSVVGDAREDTAEFDQDFALATSGHLAGPDESIVVLDRTAYSAPGVIKVSVIAPNIAGNPSATILVKSTTEPAGENYILFASGGSGSFTGSVATVTGPATMDGKLQIANGDAIEARYFDLIEGSNRTAIAVADLVPPALDNVVVARSLGDTVVTWTSDEPSDSVVRFNTNAVLSRAFTNSVAGTNHQVTLQGLIPGKTYYFLVTSADAAGNVATNDNSGSLYSFVAAPANTVLLVNDYSDPYYTIPPLSGYTSSLNNLGVAYTVWDEQNLGPPALSDLLAYRVVIWRVPEFYGTLTAAEQNMLSTYLHAGGSIFISSMNLLTLLDEGGYGGFWKSVLQVQSYTADAGVEQLIGAGNDPISSGINTAMDYTPYHDDSKAGAGIPDDVSDTIIPMPNAAPVFYNENNAACGLRYPRTGVDSPGRVVFLSFPIDTIPNTQQATNNRITVMGNIMRFLAPGFDGRATLALDAPAYALPSQATIQIDDPDLAGSGSLSASVSSTTQTNATLLTLPETTRRGTFRGVISVVYSTNPPASGTLRVQGGDTIKVDYLDVSSAQTLHAYATVDILAPTITGVISQPDYVEATISWTTSEPSDSLVQFGESPLSFRTAYDPTLSVNHTVTLSGLKPATLYYFRLVSKDSAGNTTINDNNGQYYTFTTLQPLLPPWSDNMDGTAPGWTVYNSSQTESHWIRGQPNNGEVTNGFSPPNVWGSNLNGDSLDISDTMLISPTINLIGGNSAHLTFWHNYDFTDVTGFDFESGSLYVVTNSLSEPAVLHTYGNVSGGWQQVDVDLTPFIGQVINIVWHYQLFSGAAAPRPGWLVDDVSVTITNIPGGTIEITNNLWQSHFVLSGPLNRTGKGLSLIVTNAPPGQYTITYSDVPYYQTPPPQSGSLASGGSIEFQGNYTFTDDNSNGIPDGWETFYFGSVTNNRTSLSDTDGDGMSDYAESLAGTDPNSPLKPFPVTAAVTNGNFVQFNWSTAPGHPYRVDVSTHLPVWTPFSGWINATTQSTNYLAPLPTNAAVRLFRVETDSGNVPDNLAISKQIQPDGSLRLTWLSVIDHAYRVNDSLDMTNWVPVSPWIQAVGPNTSYLLPSIYTNSIYKFLIEAAP